MPTYQYRCTQCGTALEAVQKFTDPALTECPQCAGALRKVFNAVGVVFRGSGFYRTDSRKANGSTSATGESGTSEKPAGDGSTASKPAKSDTAASGDKPSTGTKDKVKASAAS